MANDTLRPDLEITQVFQTPAPVVLGAPLTLVIFGVNRQMVWRDTAGSYGPGEYGPYDFPGLDAGAAVERDTATEEILRPHVYISNEHGIAEVIPTYDWLTDPPTFSLSATLSATFEISAGSTGDWSATTGKFTDDNADFVEDQVAAGDEILIDGTPSLDITAIDGTTELSCTKIDKGPQLWAGDLSAEDANDDRTLTDPTSGRDFVEDGVIPGDLLNVIGWDILSQADGIDYGIETLGVRLMTGPTQNFTTLLGPIPGPPATVDMVWIKDLSSNWVPAFTVTGNQITATTAEIQNNLTVWPATATEDINEPFEIYRYTQYDLTGGTVYTDAAGSYTTLAGTRTFQTLTAAIDFVVIVAALGGSIGNYAFAAADSFGAMRPLFKFAPAPAPTASPNSTVQVVDWDPTRPGTGASVGAGLTWEIWDDTGTPVAAFLGSDITAEDSGDSDKRTLTSTYNTFSTDGVVAGDIIYSDTGVALFLVTDVDSETVIRCLNIVSGNPAPSWSDSEFGFYIADQTEATLLVKQVVSASVLAVRNVLAGSPPAGAFTDLYYTIKIADALEDANYTIEKTVTAPNLTGTVLSTFMARKNDLLGQAFEVDEDTEADLLGFPVPANPLAMAVNLALRNTPNPVFCMQVEDDTLAEWLASMEYAKVSGLYCLVPLTEDELVLSAYRAFVIEESLPETKREKILFQTHRFERIETRRTDTGGSWTKTATSTTIVINDDLDAYGVIIGDVFTGTATLTAGGTQDFTARILTISAGATTTLTIVNDNSLPVDTNTLVTWTITSKALTDAQFADKIGAYPATIKQRRIRNTYPDRCEVTFTDQTDPTETSGFYGGGDQTEEVPGYFAAAIEGAKRTGQRPGQPITKFPGTGITSLINPFGNPEGGNEDLNDRILNGGNWLLSQPVEEGEFYALRAVTTDVSDLFKLEDHVTTQVDNFTKLLRRQIRPLLGPFNIEESFFDLVSGNVEAVRQKVLDDKNAKSIDFLGIEQDLEHSDQFLFDFDFGPFISGAKARVTIYV